MNEDGEKTFEETIRGIGNWFGKNLPGIFVILISIFFLFTGVIKVVPTEMNWKEQTIMTFLTIIAGFSITSLVGEYGFSSAKKSDKFRRCENEYDAAVKQGLKYREPIDELAMEKAEANLKSVRLHLLEGVNLYYPDIFDDDGRLKTDFDITKFKNEKGFTKKLRAYHTAVRMKIRNVNVFSMASSSVFGITKEKSEKSYRTETSVRSLITKVLLSIGTVGIMFQFLGWDVSAFIYAFMQIVLWIAMGLISRQKNFNFIYDEIIPQINNRKLIIEEFMAKSDAEKDAYILKAKQRHTKVKQLPYIENNDQKENSR